MTRRTSIEAGLIEMQTMTATQGHIAEVRKKYSNEQLEAWLRGSVSSYASALAEIVGPKEAFEIFSRMADREMLLSCPDNK